MKRVMAALAVIVVYGCIAQAAPEGNRVAVYGPTLDPMAQARVEAMLATAGIQPAAVDMTDDWSRYALLVMVDAPAPPELRGGKALSFVQKLASYYFCGGRVLVVGIPGTGSYPATPNESWNRLTLYFWNTSLRFMAGVMEDSDHRASFFPAVPTLGSQKNFDEVMERLLAARDELPADVPAEDFGPAPSIELRANSLWLDGKPLLLRGPGYYTLTNQVPLDVVESEFRAYHELGFNAVISIASYDLHAAKFRDVLQLARKYGIYIQLQVQGPLDSDDPVRKEYMLKFLRFRNDPMLIGWELCDDMYDIYYPYIAREASIIRRYDHRLPITGTFLDLRHPEHVKDWGKWKALMNFPLTYLYPMQRDLSTLGIRPNIEGGLKDIDRLQANTRQVWGDVFSEQFEQAHMQDFVVRMALQPWAEFVTPMADQERLMTYRALLSGVKGQIYFYPGSLDDQAIGRDRRNELGMVWHTLGLVDDILARGEPPIPLNTSDPTVSAALINGGTESVIVLVKDLLHYDRYVDHVNVEGLRVELPTGQPSKTLLYQLGWPRAKKVAIEGSGDKPYLDVPNFTLTSLLLLTNDSAHVEAIQQKMAEELPEVARYAVSVLGDEQIKTEVVAQRLPADLAGESSLLGEARGEGSRARAALKAGDASTAWEEARAGLTLLEKYRAQAMRAAEADADRRHASKEARVFLNIYFSLPNYAYITRGGERVQPGELRRQILEAEGENVWPSASISP